MTTYFLQLNKRNNKLKILNFNNYQNFLKSSLWKDIKYNWVNWAKKHNKYQCFCGETDSLQLHHLRYGKISKIGGSGLNLIIAVCGKHHKEISELSYKTGISIKQATKIIKNQSIYFRK